MKKFEAVARDGQPFWISEDDLDLLKYTWRIDRNGYAVRSGWDVNGTHRRLRSGNQVLKGKGKVIKLHKVIAARLKIVGLVGHINRNRTDCSRENLRQATFTLNLINSSLRKDNTSGHKGVCWDKSKKLWLVRFLKKATRCRSFAEAVDIRKDWEKQYA